MSKQLSISAVFSVLAMAALALQTSPAPGSAKPLGLTGAPISIEAPVELPVFPALRSLAD